MIALLGIAVVFTYDVTRLPLADLWTWIDITIDLVLLVLLVRIARDR